MAGHRSGYPGTALNRGSGPNQAEARKRPDRSTTTQTCFQALDEVAFGRKDTNELLETGIEAMHATQLSDVLWWYNKPMEMPLSLLMECHQQVIQ